MKQNFLLLVFLQIVFSGICQKGYISPVWVPDNGNGTYKNPVINADYSDPDAVRVGDDFYMIASSFDAVPGLPILHSKDLVNWTIIGHALKRQPPFDVFNKTQHGNGVWAPAIRYHNNEFYIYYPDPDFGIYLIKANNITGPWSEPHLVVGGKGLIDPCPLWDDDGKAYLTHAYAGSRAGMKSVIVVKEMNKEGTKIIGDGVLVFDGHENDPTVEGPKFYKRNGYYYIFAPAGGVATGWQLVLRSKNVYGPYERRVVMAQGKSPVNGPHQGAWIATQTGEDWFLHFQDKGALGRVVHLQPMKWMNDWPVIGIDKNGKGIGEPVAIYKKPNVGKKIAVQTPPDTDEFDEVKMGLQWQWQANPQETWAFMYPEKGVLKMFAKTLPEGAANLWDVPNVLLQKFPNDEFQATAKVKITPAGKLTGEKMGLTTMALNYANIAVKAKKDGQFIVFTTCQEADKGNKEVEKEIAKLNQSEVYFRLKFYKDTTYKFSYSLDGKKFTEAGSMKAVPGKWIGIKMGFFATSELPINDAASMDVDWFRVEK
ncbi:MAG TPA: glycoside hydrolase 43 family protein [Niabella sp.]|jgi:beta-xylosidase|nr:glycoside hydrolase 43 family protein [Chitinophagaceae bacterium]HUN04144.1 glycoside hydrolase 43 family protein [Niabella sp.]